MKHYFKMISWGVICITMISTLFLTTGCKKKHPLSNTLDVFIKYDERQKAAKSAKELLLYIDSLRQEDIIGDAEAELLRGDTYCFFKDDDLAGEHYKKSYELYCLEPNPTSDKFATAALKHSNFTSNTGTLEEATQILTETLYKLEDKEDLSERKKSILYSLLATNQGRLELKEEAKQTYEKAYQSIQKLVQQELDSPVNLSITCLSATEVFFAEGEYETADLWRNRTEELLTIYCEDLKHEGVYDIYKQCLTINKIRDLVVKGKKAEAIQLYRTTPHDVLLQSYGFTYAILLFLEEAGLYKEAADLYDRTDTTYNYVTGKDGTTFDSFLVYHAPRYRVYRKAGRTDVALAFADSVFSNIDSADVKLKRDKAAELATIYHTHDKELELKDAQADIRIHRILLYGTGLFLILIGFFFIRTYQHNQELRAKNRSLFEQMQKREQEEQDMLHSLQVQPEETLSFEQQLFRRICTLMSEKQPYTDESLNREELARMLGSNTKYVGQAIHECSHGETVTDFITRYRLEHVARLLRTTDEPVNLIGEMSGIPSRATLARLFRNTYGMTCSEYRQVATRPGKA